jgi:C1A family cysteine protease
MASDDRMDLSELQASIMREGASWQAGPTSVSALPQEERRRRLGADLGDLSVEQIERQAAARKAALDQEVRAVGAPAAFDSRNIGGSNYITPIKDQGGCGSCVAFGTVAAIEGRFRRQRSDPNMQVDLSEAHLFYCHGRSKGRNCGNGWIPNEALEMCKTIGIVDEGCYPYTAADQNCSNLCSDWQNRVVKLTGWRQISAVSDMKEWVAGYGPLTACFIVYNDFFNYRSGVYRHVSGDAAGGHCVSIIGYDDGQGCWICKNSWGAGWGESGFFRIAYGDSGIDTWQVCAPENILETGWQYTKKIQGLWTNNVDRNGWVYVESLGWRKVAANNDNVHFDMLFQLMAAKAASRPVNLYQDNGVITQLYVL